MLDILRGMMKAVEVAPRLCTFGAKSRGEFWFFTGGRVDPQGATRVRLMWERYVRIAVRNDFAAVNASRKAANSFGLAPDAHPRLIWPPLDPRLSQPQGPGPPVIWHTSKLRTDYVRRSMGWLALQIDLDAAIALPRYATPSLEASNNVAQDGRTRAGGLPSPQRLR